MNSLLSHTSKVYYICLHLKISKHHSLLFNFFCVASSLSWFNYENHFLFFHDIKKTTS